MKILVITGSRADYGMLEWPIKVLSADPFFDVEVCCVTGQLTDDGFEYAYCEARSAVEADRPDIAIMLGDRFEILAAATACHLDRVPIAHIAGGDVTEGSYDDAMRDCISRMASIHFVTSSSAMARLTHMGLRNVHLVGSPGIDYIKHADWRKERPIKEPYVVVNYQVETIDGTNDFSKIRLPKDKRLVFIMPNPDRGSDHIRVQIEAYRRICADSTTVYESLLYAEYLNLMAHADEVIGNSSSMLYECPELGVKTRMIGKRQLGRTIPWGDGNASERIAKVFKYSMPIPYKKGENAPDYDR